MENNDLSFPGGVKIPLRPSIGLIATTPSRPKNTASDSGSYGGDMDLKDHGNMTEAARLLGLHRSNLYRKMQQLEMLPTQ